MFEKGHEKSSPTASSEILLMVSEVKGITYSGMNRMNKPCLTLNVTGFSKRNLVNKKSNNLKTTVFSLNKG